MGHWVTCLKSKTRTPAAPQVHNYSYPLLSFEKKEWGRGISPPPTTERVVHHHFFWDEKEIRAHQQSDEGVKIREKQQQQQEKGNWRMLQHAGRGVNNGVCTTMGKRNNNMYRVLCKTAVGVKRNFNETKQKW